MRRQLSPNVILLVVAILCIFASCSSENDKAEVLIIDNNRHYYPVVQGNTMDVYFELRDTTRNAVIINEIQTSSGLKLQNAELPITIVPNKPVILYFKYNTNLNVGYVKHDINLYGNFPDSTYRTLRFDVHIVPPADYLHDYEALYSEKNSETKLHYTDKAYREQYYLEKEY